MGVGTQPAIAHEHITGWSARMDRLHPSQIVAQEGRHHSLQEPTSAGMEQPQQPRHGKAAPRPRLRRPAESSL